MSSGLCISGGNVGIWMADGTAEAASEAGTV